MKILNASDAKREFGEVLINAQHGPVGICLLYTSDAADDS